MLRNVLAVFCTVYCSRKPPRKNADSRIQPLTLALGNKILATCQTLSFTSYIVLVIKE